MTRVADLASHPAASVRDEVWAGLSATPKSLPTKFLYDDRGSRLFQEITDLEEYYPTRTETGILIGCLPELARRIGPRARVVEPGSGSGDKARMLLDALENPSAYLPVDVSAAQLRRLADGLRSRHPELEVLPVVADYTRTMRLPRPSSPSARTIVFFPGSTIGNFEPEPARSFLEHLAREAGVGGALILGTDLVKPASILQPAYDDAKGVTAAFNLNVLRHLNRVMGTDFALDGFRHEAVWNPDRSRIEMRLVSLKDQGVTVPRAAAGPAEPAESDIDLPPDRAMISAGERIVTEHSYKYTSASLDALTREAGWSTVQEWTDEDGWFSIRYLERTVDRPHPAGNDGSAA